MSSWLKILHNPKLGSKTFLIKSSRIFPLQTGPVYFHFGTWDFNCFVYCFVAGAYISRTLTCSSHPLKCLLSTFYRVNRVLSSLHVCVSVCTGFTSKRIKGRPRCCWAVNLFALLVVPSPTLGGASEEVFGAGYDAVHSQCPVPSQCLLSWPRDREASPRGRQWITVLEVQ